MIILRTDGEWSDYYLVAAWDVPDELGEQLLQEDQEFREKRLAERERFIKEILHDPDRKRKLRHYDRVRHGDPRKFRSGLYEKCKAVGKPISFIELHDRQLIVHGTSE